MGDATSDDGGAAIVLRDLREDERPWASAFLRDAWGFPVVSISGVFDDPSRLPGVVAELDGERAGLATYRVDDAGCEVVTLDAFVRRRGVGTALLGAVRARAGARRVWLVTTDENLAAIACYRRAGMDLVGLHRDFVDVVARHKDLPTTPGGGTGFRHALVFAFDAAHPAGTGARSGAQAPGQ